MGQRESKKQLYEKLLAEVKTVGISIKIPRRRVKIKEDKIIKLDFRGFLKSKSLDGRLFECSLLRFVEEIDFALSELTTFPENLQKLPQLRNLDLSYNKIQAIPESVGELTNLEKLFVRGTFPTLPESIGNLTKLQKLGLQGKLATIPESIGNLTNLESLSLSNNQLTELPKSIGKLANLKYLFLENNRLRTIPEEIGDLTKLEWLDLRNNQLTSLPESIGNLINLRELDLSFNELTSLPKGMSNLIALESLCVESNKKAILKSVRELMKTLEIKASMDVYHTCAHCGKEKIETEMYYCEKCRKHYCQGCEMILPGNDSYGEFEKVWVLCPKNHVQGSDWRRSKD